MKKTFFSFEFSFTLKTGAVLMFELIPPSNITLEDWEQKLHDIMENNEKYIENKYGLHDCCGTSNSNCMIIGYFTDEISKSKAYKVMEDWKKIFEKELSPLNVKNIENGKTLIKIHKEIDDCFTPSYSEADSILGIKEPKGFK